MSEYELARAEAVGETWNEKGTACHASDERTNSSCMHGPMIISLSHHFSIIVLVVGLQCSSLHASLAVRCDFPTSHHNWLRIPDSCLMRSRHLEPVSRASDHHKCAGYLVSIV